jgi:ArsR family transcriptional regulator
MATKSPLPLAVADRVRGCCVPITATLPDQQADDIATLAKAIADPTRVQILHALKAAAEPVCVCDFTEAFDLGQPTISHHLAKLKAAGLVDSEKRGVWAFYSLRHDLTPSAKAALALIP